MPWLELDIVDHLGTLYAGGIESVVVCPVGFVSDHLEVGWDLDNEAARRAGELGMGFVRAATRSGDPRFAEKVAELVREHTAGAEPRKLSTFPAAGYTDNGAPCALGCYEPAMAARARF